jgi:hypothetical protein
MAEIQEEKKKSPNVELDTDGIEEQNIEVVEQEKKSDKSDLNLGEVDLGYTDHSKQEKEEEPKKPSYEVIEEPAEEPKQPIKKNLLKSQKKNWMI